MENFFSFDINSYRRMTAGMDGPHVSPPSPRDDENRTHSFQTHPLREALPSLEIVQGPIQSSVHRMRASAPIPKSLTEFMSILPRYGSGESWESLHREFPALNQYASNNGLSQRGIDLLIKHLDTKSMDRLVDQVKKRINILCSGEFRDLALESLKTTVATARARAGNREIVLEESGGAKKDKEFYKKFIRDFLKIIHRFEAGEPTSSLAETIPNISSFIRNDGFTKKADKLLDNITTEDKKRIELAFTRRKQSTSRKKRSSQPADASSKLTGILRMIYHDPKLLINISKRFSNPSNSINHEVCDYLITTNTLRKIIDMETGELTPTGEQAISQADASIQALIRANFRLRSQAPSIPATETAARHQSPSHGQHPVPPGDSFFSGVSGEIRRRGYPAPATPQYPPTSPAVSDLVSYQDLYYGQPYVPPGDSIFSGVSEEMRRRGYAEPETPQYPQSPASTFGDLSFLNEGAYSARDFDLNTPAEVIQPWLGDDHYSATPAASSPERIDVDALPSPQDSSTSISAARELGPSEAEWLGDEHMVAYIGTIADRLEGQPRAELLNFADSLLVTQLIQGDREQRQNAMHQIMGRGGPIIFMPVNNPQSHWSLLVIDQRTGEAFHYDSLVPPWEAGEAAHTNQYKLASRAAQAMGIHGPVQGMPIARQRDGHSCGDHVLQAIETLAHSVIDGTFRQPHTMDLSDLETDRGLIADTIASARAHRNAEPAPAASRTHERPAKKSRKWWKF